MSVISVLLRGKNISKLRVCGPGRKDYSDRSHGASRHILHSDLTEVPIPKVSIDEFLFANTDKWSQRIAAECASTGRKYTYEQVRRQIINLSRNLRKKLKLQKGDVLAVLLPNLPEYIIATAGPLKAGLVVTTINPIYTADEISRQLKDSSTRAVITLVELYQLARRSVDLSQSPINIITIKTEQNQAVPTGALNFDEFIENVEYPDLAPLDCNEVAILPYSSGTTGMPKGVQLTHYNVIANQCQFDTPELAVIQETTKEHQDVIPSVLPQFHIYGLAVSTFYLFAKGSKTVSLSKFSPELYIKVLRNHKPDVLFVAPPLVHFLTSFPSVTSKDLQSVRTLMSGAAPLGALDEERFRHKAQKEINILQGYGLTETSPLVIMTGKDLHKIPNSTGSIGRPVPYTFLKIVDPNDANSTPLGPNQTGELLVKGPQVMKGYLNRPEETKETLTEDGWLRTGDMMYYDDNNLLFVKDRLKELIKVKGFQVAPAELEEIIRDFPDVQDAAVVGIPHATHGEVPRAFIVQKEGKSVNVAQLEEFVAEKVASYKRLAGGIQVVPTIPKNATGKILRKTLKEQYQ